MSEEALRMLKELARYCPVFGSQFGAWATRLGGDELVERKLAVFLHADDSQKRIARYNLTPAGILLASTFK